MVDACFSRLTYAGNAIPSGLVFSPIDCSVGASSSYPSFSSARNGRYSIETVSPVACASLMSCLALARS